MIILCVHFWFSTWKDRNALSDSWLTQFMTFQSLHTCHSASTLLWAHTQGSLDIGINLLETLLFLPGIIQCLKSPRSLSLSSWRSLSPPARVWERGPLVDRKLFLKLGAEAGWQPRSQSLTHNTSLRSFQGLRKSGVRVD